MAKRRKKKDAGAIIFRLIGIELLIITIILVIAGIRYLPDLMGRLGLTEMLFGSRQTGQQEAVVTQAQAETMQPNVDTQAAVANTTEGAAVVQNIGETTEEAIEEVVLSSLSLVAVGDNLMHRSSTLSGQQADGSYSFYNHFCNMEPIFKAADITVISQDTVMAGEEYGVTSGEVFNTVPQVADYMEDAGINVVLAANNHILDMKKDGMVNMIRTFQGKENMALLGVNESEAEQNTPYYMDVNDIRVAMINYGWYSNVSEDLAAEPYLVNLAAPGENDEWLTQMVAQAKQEADFVIVYPHWGSQNSLEATEEQQQQAKLLADAGADLIIGAYPHVVEPVRWITGENGNETLVYYSLGNFQSVQDTTQNMLGGLASVTITKTTQRTYISDYDLDFTVTHYAKQSETEYFDIVTTFPWDSYAENLAELHGIVEWDPDFSYESLASLRQQILDSCELQ